MIASAPAACRARNRGREVSDFAGRAGILQQRAEHRRGIERGQRIADNDAPAERLGARSHHGNGLRMAIGIDEEGFLSVAGQTMRHRHRFGRGSAFIEQRRIGDIEPGEIGDHGLEIQQGFEASLADLRLIRRVGRVPGRIFQDVALDHRRQDRPVIALPDQRCADFVLACDLPQFVERLASPTRRVCH